MWWFLGCVGPSLIVEAPEVWIRVDLSTCDGVDGLVEAEVVDVVWVGQPTALVVADEPDLGVGLTVDLDLAVELVDGIVATDRIRTADEALLRTRAAAWCSLERPVLPGEHSGSYELYAEGPDGALYADGSVVVAVD